MFELSSDNGATPPQGVALVHAYQELWAAEQTVENIDNSDRTRPVIDYFVDEQGVEDTDLARLSSRQFANLGREVLEAFFEETAIKEQLDAAVERRWEIAQKLIELQRALTDKTVLVEAIDEDRSPIRQVRSRHLRGTARTVTKATGKIENPLIVGTHSQRQLILRPVELLDNIFSREYHTPVIDDDGRPLVRIAVS